MWEWLIDLIAKDFSFLNCKMENSVYRILTLQEINKIAFLKVLGLVYYKYDNVNIGCFFLIMAFHFFITFFVRKYTLLCWDGWKFFENFNIVVVQPLSHVQLFATPQTAAQQASLSLTISQSLLQLIFIKSVMPSNHLVLCCPFSSCLQSFPVSDLFQWVSSSHQVAKVLGFQLQHQSFQWMLRTDFL